MPEVKEKAIKNETDCVSLVVIRCGSVAPIMPSREQGHNA